MHIKVFFQFSKNKERIEAGQLCVTSHKYEARLSSDAL